MGCEVIREGHFTAIVCGRGQRPAVKCGVCGSPNAFLLCDFPDPTRRSKTCDTRLCQRCAVSRGDEDYCPTHAVIELPKLPL